MKENIKLFTLVSDSSDEVSSEQAGGTSETKLAEETDFEVTSSNEGMSWHPEASFDVIPKVGVGMVVIFAIIGVIIFATALLGKITSGKKNKQ